MRHDRIAAAVTVAALLAAACSSGAGDGSDAAADPSPTATAAPVAPTTVTAATDPGESDATVPLAEGEPDATAATDTTEASTDATDAPAETSTEASDAGDGVGAASAGPSFAPLPEGYDGYVSEVYADDSSWMCRPGLADDVCEGDLDATAVFADGTTEPRPHEAATDPAVDCFYVYPTVSRDPTANSDREVAEDQEVATVLNQAARLGAACRVFAPIYRQITLTALSGAVAADEAARATAAADVLDAFRHFVANDAADRPFVLVGHSQGAGILNRLISEEIDTEPALRERMVSAILLGTTVAVGAHPEVPACTSASDVGCLVSYSTYRATAPPAPGAFFGSADGEPAVCVNPVDPAGGAAGSTPYFRVGGGGLLGGSATPFDPGVDASVETEWVTYPDMLTVECRDDGVYGWLSIETTTAPGPRTDDIGGDLTPEWGMHLVDANIAMGDLVELVRGQSVAFGG
ncbi:DUF3089 domain-containing protein [Ilumatobacter sp.]|uniref:DUF3089 domain-containing protein n=1 Tax=Ilumatobacter sp. TaxID=1967498 RepID=UPI003B529C2C